ncbi:LOW QUALITY PROTEIN: cell adhesion molecule CEACAM6-like, partial [Lissotriton helveticus]
VCLSVCIQQASAQGAAAKVTNARVGETAIIPAPVNVNILTFGWYRGTVVDNPQLIYTYFVSTSGQVNGPQYTGRETGRPDGSLQIRDLLTSHTGNYTVNVTPSGAAPVTTTRLLRVYELVTKPTVTSEPSQLVENRGPAVITCDTSSAAVTILWSFNSTSALPGNIIPSPDNRTLTITNVSRGDSGIYQCVAMNPVSSSASDPQTLIVAYGPENMRIDPPTSQWLLVGDTLSLSCTAGSVPASQYQWHLNGTDLNSPGNTYIIEKVSSKDNGNYTCVADNTVTGLSAQASVSVTVNGRPCPTPCTCWQITLGVACGVLLGAVIIVAGMAVHYERRLKQKVTNKESRLRCRPSVHGVETWRPSNLRADQKALMLWLRGLCALQKKVDAIKNQKITSYISVQKDIANNSKCFGNNVFSFKLICFIGAANVTNYIETHFS